MNYTQALNFIHSTQRFGSKLGLERMRELMERLGDPQDRLQYVHVAGTNGKGSSATMLANILERAGFRTGKYISPYVYDFRERISVNGALIPPEQLALHTERVKKVTEQMKADGWDDVTEFEIVTAIGFLHFAAQACDIVVLEVGLGGRFDATNIIAAPLVAMIMSISLDHTAILGDTIAKIAGEKCGIIKSGCAVVSYPCQQPEALDVIRAAAAQNGAQLRIPRLSGVSEAVSTLRGNDFCYDGKRYHLNLIGKYQIYNALTVLETVSALRQRGFSIDEKAVADGLSRCRMDARFDRVCESPEIVLDVGHNPQGIDALLDIIKEEPRKIVLIYAVMRDKDYRYAVERLAGRADKFYAVAPDDLPRALPAAEIAAAARPYCADTRAFERLEDAVRLAVGQAKDELILICGSFYMMEQTKKILKSLSCFSTE